MLNNGFFKWFWFHQEPVGEVGDGNDPAGPIIKIRMGV